MSFAKGIKNWADKTGLSINDAVNVACFQLSSEIIKRTPVLTGRLRSNWIPTIDNGTNEMRDATEPNMTELKSVSNKAAGHKFFLTNNLPYVRRIEYEGHSKIKAPQGMVRISIENFKLGLK